MSDSQFNDANLTDVDWDDASVVTFAKEWHTLTQFVQEHGSGSTLEKAVAWMETLYSKRHKWAYCHIMAVIIWGVNSTQRSEAANSAYKRGRILAGYSLVRCLEVAIEYNRDSRFRKEVDAVRSRLKHIGQQALQSPEVTSLHGKVTPYGLDLIAAQMSQMLRYTAEPIVDEFDEYGDSLFTVTFLPGNLDTADLELDADTGRIASFADDNDLGIGEGSMLFTGRMNHQTSVNYCSCQLRDHPCRHILHIRHCVSSQKGKGKDLLQLVGVKWHSFDKDAEAALVKKLNKTPLQPSAAPAHQAVLPYKERYELLMNELRPLAQMGAKSMHHMNALLVEIESVSKSLASVTVSGVSATGSSATSSEQAGPSNPATNSAAAKLSTDSKHLKATLGQRFIIAAAPPPECLQFGAAAGAQLLGSQIAFKWNEKNRSGWLIGEILRQFDASASNDDCLAIVSDPTDTFVSQWEDGTIVSHALNEDGYWATTESPVNQPFGSWCMLKSKPLSDNVAEMAQSGSLHNPENLGKRGRPESRRKKATHGGPGS